MSMKSFENFDVRSKRVFVRVDFNVPIHQGEIQDDTRIRAALPTLESLLERGAALVVASHLGRPKGEDPKLSLRPVAKRLGELLGRQVAFCPRPAGQEALRMAGELRGGDLLILENLRFHPGEKKDDPEFAAQLAALADLYVDDAFGTAHRPAASIVGIAKLLPAAAGALLMKEIDTLHRLASDPPRPLVMLAGGAKISDKIAVIDRLSDKIDLLLVGGAMAFAFLKARGHGIGKSLLDSAGVPMAGRLLESSLKILLPKDFRAAASVEPGTEHCVVAADAIPENLMGLDIGPATIDCFRPHLASAGTVLWNGPMGLFEVSPFDEGTGAVGRILADASGLSIVGGGETGEIVRKLGLAHKMSHVSTGGGAFLSYLSGETLPGIEVLRQS